MTDKSFVGLMEAIRDSLKEREYILNSMIKVRGILGRVLKLSPHF